MKTFILFTFLVVTTMFGASSVSAQCDPSLSQIKCSYYNEGYQDGTNDFREGRSNDYKRYRDKYERKYEADFRDGYRAGYSNGSIVGGSTPANSEYLAYDRGYWLGGSDVRTNQNRDYKKYSAQYDRRFEKQFRSGYDDGYYNRPRQYETAPVPIYPPTPTYPPIYPPTYPPIYPPVYPGPGGDTSGSATWSGRVDDKVNLVIRGGSITPELVAGNTMQTRYSNMNGTLPRRASTVSARKSDGRGNVDVIQQPNRSNDFTAIVQVSDPRGGSGDYKVDINWSSTGGNVEEPYRSGRVVWRGRVDQTVNITVAGSTVEAEDVAGTGLSNTNFSIDGYLANRPGSVNVRRVRGRGTVKVLEQPSWNNGFVAVIQIFDPNNGSDNYEVEISW